MRSARSGPRQHRLFVRQIGTRGIPLQTGLLVGGEAQYVVDDRAGGQLGVRGLHARVGGCVADAGQYPRHRLRLTGREAGRHQLGAVGVRQQRIAQARADSRDAVAPTAWRIVDGLRMRSATAPRSCCLLAKCQYSAPGETFSSRPSLRMVRSAIP